MTRLKADRYYTNPQLARAIVERCRQRGILRDDSRVLEPSCGTGAFLRELGTVAEATGVDVELTPEARSWESADIRSRRALYECDWLSFGKPDGYRPRTNAPTLILGNPPFDGAEDHIRHALGCITPTGAVVMLLRSSLLGSGERVIAGWHEGRTRPLWEEHQPTWIDYVAPRPSFTGGGSDTAEYVVVTWQPALIAAGWGPPRVSWLVWRTERIKGVGRVKHTGKVSTAAVAVEDASVPSAEVVA